MVNSHNFHKLERKSINLVNLRGKEAGPIFNVGTVLKKISPVDLLPPERGLPSRERQILKSLILFVCLLSVRIFREISREYKRRLHRLYSRLIFGSPKTDPASLSFKSGWSLHRGPKIFVFFSFLVHSKSACSEVLVSKTGMHIPLVVCCLLESEVPFQGANCPAGPN